MYDVSKMSDLHYHTQIHKLLEDDQTKQCKQHDYQFSHVYSFPFYRIRKRTKYVVRLSCALYICKHCKHTILTRPQPHHFEN